MARFCTLCSSSSGNSTYIGYAGGGILIDAGTNAKRLTAALDAIGVEPQSLQAIFITHEHADHIGALRVFASRYHLPVYATKGTLSELERNGDLRGVEKAFVMPGNGVEAGGMEIHSFRTSHDCAESCGYTVLLPDERKISVMTDTGVMTEEARQSVKGSDLILLESNYDRAMLNAGPYPYYLKQRIESARGHLSNDDCAKAACEFVNSGTTHIVLGHLSRENNTPGAAYRGTQTALGEMGAMEGLDYLLQVAPPELGERMVIL